MTKPISKERSGNRLKRPIDVSVNAISLVSRFLPAFLHALLYYHSTFTRQSRQPVTTRSVQKLKLPVCWQTFDPRSLRIKPRNYVTYSYLTFTMETVNNLVSTASHLIWGEGNSANGQKENETKGQEPLSGETGNVEEGEPYDKGNAGKFLLPCPPLPLTNMRV